MSCKIVIALMGECLSIAVDASFRMNEYPNQAAINKNEHEALQIIINLKLSKRG